MCTFELASVRRARHEFITAAVVIEIYLFRITREGKYMSCVQEIDEVKEKKTTRSTKKTETVLTTALRNAKINSFFFFLRRKTVSRYNPFGCKTSDVKSARV